MEELKRTFSMSSDDENELEMSLDRDDLLRGQSSEYLFARDRHEQGSKTGRELDNYISDIAESVRVAMDQSVAILTPWFFSNMPQFYYQTTPRYEKVRDLHAVITGHIFESKQKLQLWNRDKTKVTFLAPGNEEGIFHDIAHSTDGQHFNHGSMFTSNDRLLLIASFYTNKYEKVDLENNKNRGKVEETIKLLADEPEAEVRTFLQNLDNQMVIRTTPARLGRMFKLAKVAQSHEDAITHLVPNFFHDYARLDIAYKKMDPGETLTSILFLLERYGFQINRCIISVVSQHTTTPISIFTFIMRHDSGEGITDKFVPFLKANKAVKTLRWVDQDNYDTLLFETENEKRAFSVNEINLLRAIGEWVQIFLSKLNPYYYSEERVLKTFSRNPGTVRDLIKLFRLLFDPRIGRDERGSVEEFRAQVMGQIENIESTIERDILGEATNFLTNILKTNYFSPRKTGLSFRLDPKCLDPEFYPQTPHGFFYLIGRGYRGFHVRYRDTARGGLRIVMPREMTQYEQSFAGLFDEVIGLAYAQQLKNKDIPEGGAKGVLLLKPGADRETAAIGAVDSILNLIAIDPQTGKLDASITDLLGIPEYIFLGPDENCTNELIEAFVRLAHHQRYGYPNAFMSSKPTSGINHKEFGVTSEGINVFLDNMLRELGIDPHKSTFTVKMTGGPDGDVAGNELNILHREYGENARVVAIADGFGAAYDPKGLDWQELLRLFHEGHPINQFDAAKLSQSKDAFVINADTKEHVRIRNELHARVEADIFIPAGGRPYTVHKKNWQLFLREDGTPSVRGIVEGANIFFTKEARESLQKAGILFFKDSSANKCGVICSSFEILSSMILTEGEFAEIKTEYVAQVIDRLRMKADQEAQLLLQEFHDRGKTVNLVKLSEMLSAIINRVTDLVMAELLGQEQDPLQDETCQQIILDYVPPVLVEKFPDRILKDIPRSYLLAIIAADMASHIVYHEGLSWLENLPNEAVVETVRVYMTQARKVKQLLVTLSEVKFSQAEELAAIVSMAGARSLTRLAQKRQ